MNDKTFNYKGFYGSIDFDVEASLLYGKILHVRDLVNYEGDSLSQLRVAFEEAVDDYLETCVSLGKSPDKPYTGSFNIRIGPDLHRGLAIFAGNHDKSLNLVVTEAIRAKLNPKVDLLQIHHEHEHNHNHEYNLETKTIPSSISEFEIQSTEASWANDIQFNSLLPKQH